MSGETQKSVSGWTTDTLHGLLMAVLEERDRRFLTIETNLREQIQALRRESDVRDLAQSNAIIKAEETSTDRFERGSILHTTQIADLRKTLEYLDVLKANEKLQLERIEGVRREAHDRAVATEQAIQKADAATEKRFSAVNEFRAQLADQAANFMPREVADAQINEVRKQITALTARLDLSAGKSAGSQQAIGYMIAAATLFLSLIVFLANNLFK